MLWQGSLRRDLSDETLDRYLDPGAGDRETYHAAEEISRRVQRDEASRKRFYPRIVALASSPDSTKRRVVAWAMGEDPKDPEFRQALLKLLADPVPVVAHNAALALARHGSAAARPVLLSMLQPATVVAPAEGAFQPKVKVGETAALDAPVATIATRSGETTVDAPTPGRVLTVAGGGTRVTKGQVVATLAAAQSNAYQALRALTLPGIGLAEDVAVIERFLKETPDLEDEVRAQATRTIAALKRGG